MIIYDSELVLMSFFYVFVFFRSEIMAPIYISLQVWEAASLPGLAFLSMLILFILSITLLALCTSCQRWAPRSRNSSPFVSRSPSNSGAFFFLLSSLSLRQHSRTARSSLSTRGICQELGVTQAYQSHTPHTCHMLSLIGVKGKNDNTEHKPNKWKWLFIVTLRWFRA